MVNEPILIVGAGPSGLALAIWLKLLDPNLLFRVVSDASGTGTKSRAIVVHARTLEFYRQLGIAKTIIDAGQPIESLNIMRRGERRGYLTFGEEGRGQSAFPVVLALSQERHEQILLQRLEELNGSVDWNTKVEALHQETDHVLVQINDRTERYRYVVGCDGAHSAVRTSGGIEMLGGTYPQRFYVSDVSLASKRIPHGLEISPAGGTITIAIPMAEGGDKQIRLIGCYEPKDLGRKEKETFEDVRDLVRESTKLEIDDVKWFSTYAVHHRFASRFWDRRIFLVGDAAHLHSPVGGQGMNTGIGDAANLAWKLVAAVSQKTSAEGSDSSESPDEHVHALLETYHTERIKFAQFLVKTTDTVFFYITQVSFIGWFLREIFFPYVIPLLWKLPPVPPVLFQRVSQIAIEYRDSALSGLQSHATTGKIQPGNRLPYVAFDGGRDNHEPLDKPAWQMHIYSSAHETKSSADSKFKNIVVRNWTWSSLAQKQGIMADKVYLIRPDGYIGFIGDSLQDSKLEDYIVRWRI